MEEPLQRGAALLLSSFSLIQLWSLRRDEMAESEGRFSKGRLEALADRTAPQSC
jgi:hypothetical protein